MHAASHTPTVRRGAVENKLSCAHWLRPANDDVAYVVAGTWGEEKNSVLLRDVSHSYSRKGRYDQDRLRRGGRLGDGARVFGVDLDAGGAGGGVDEEEMVEEDDEDDDVLGGRVNYSAAHAGDVTGLAVVRGAGLVLASSSLGSVSVLSTRDPSGVDLNTTHSLPLHTHGACTDVAFQASTELIATCGEDGRHCITDLATMTEVVAGGGAADEMDEMDEMDDPFDDHTDTGLNHRSGTKRSSLSKIRFGGGSHSQSVLTVGMGGVVRAWDVRASPLSEKPVAEMVDKNSHMLCSLAIHPAKPNVVVAGSSEGILSFWDMRNSTDSVSFSLQATDSPIWDVAFLPFRPTTVILCDDGGCLSLVDFNKNQDDPTKVAFSYAQQHNMEALQLHNEPFGLNSLDYDEQTYSVVCASDAETLVFARGSVLGR